MKNKPSVFGNPLSLRGRLGTNSEYAICKFLFGKDKKKYNLLAVKRGEVYKDFGVLTLVNAECKTQEEKIPIETKKSLIIGTMRMGFGHWRIAIAIASAAHYLGYKCYLLDLKSFEGSVAQKSIDFLEKWYNRASRLSQKWKLFNKFWEKVTSDGGISISSSYREKRLASLFTPVMENLPKDIPLLSAHPWVGHTAVMARIKNVMSIIPDNLPMAFWLVEGSRHCVQSPSAYFGYRTLISMEAKGSKIKYCLPKDQIILSGHYVDYEITNNIESDCERRLARLATNEPRRFLLTMGGAGAQALRFADIALTCKQYIEEKKACLLINMGDHEGRWQTLKKHLEKDGIPYIFHSDWEETKSFIKKIRTSHAEGVHIFLHADFYAAVYATNLLMRVSDVMITKPSELSFYPVPKLFIHRVGRHEAWGAIRGSEIGDGTMEASSVEALHRTLKELIENDDLLKLYCKHIIENKKDGIYDGAYIAVKEAVHYSGKK